MRRPLGANTRVVSKKTTNSAFCGLLEVAAACDTLPTKPSEEATTDKTPLVHQPPTCCLEQLSNLPLSHAPLLNHARIIQWVVLIQPL